MENRQKRILLVEDETNVRKVFSDVMNLGERIRKLRKRLGLTQKKFAGRVVGKVDYTYIGRMERGEQYPCSEKTLRRSMTGRGGPFYFSTLAYPPSKNSNSISQPEDDLFILARWNFFRLCAAFSNCSQENLSPRHFSRTSKLSLPSPFLSSAHITRNRYNLISHQDSLFHKLSSINLFSSSRLCVLIL